jgi:hypothetical protein
MSHLNDDELVLLHYGEDAGADASAHLAGCAECAGRLRALAETLSLASLPDPPERGEGYGAQVWQRLSPQLDLAPRSRVLPMRRALVRRAASFAALAAALVLSFLLGRRYGAREQPLAGQVRERVLLVAVGEQLERSQMLLVELKNAPADEALKLGPQRALADELVTSGRLYRQAALRGGEPGLAELLDELERLLVEVAAGPETLRPDDLQRLQQRIEARGLLFKVRVVGTQVREREKERTPLRPQTSS